MLQLLLLDLLFNWEIGEELDDLLIDSLAGDTLLLLDLLLDLFSTETVTLVLGCDKLLELLPVLSVMFVFVGSFLLQRELQEELELRFLDLRLDFEQSVDFLDHDLLLDRFFNRDLLCDPYFDL